MLLLAASGFAAWALDRWDPPAEPDPWLVRRALLRAETELRRDSPKTAEELGRRIDLARASDAPGRWDEPLALASRSLRETAIERGEIEDRWRRQRELVAADLERAREQQQTPGLGRREAEQLRIAEMAWGRAQRHAEREELGSALEAVNDARDATARIEEAWQRILQRFERDDLLREWSAWAAETVAESRRTGGIAMVVDKVLRRLTVYSGGQPVRRFTVELGVDGLRRKLFAGDRATPEGLYRVSEIKTGGATRFYKALLLDYPNAADQARYRRAMREGRVPRGRGIGGLIEIHGHGGRGVDWTDGCVALTDAEMDWLLPRVRIGTPVALVGSLPGTAVDKAGKVAR